MAKTEGLLAQLRQEAGPQELVVDKNLVLPVPTTLQVRAWDAATDGEEKLRALLGDQYDTVIALFNDEPIQVWHGFLDAYYEFAFGKGANSVEGK